MANIFNALSQLGKGLSDAASHAERSGGRIAAAVRGAAQNGATALDDFIYLLKQKIAQGDDLAQSVLDIIGQVEEGTLRADQAAKAFSGIKSNITGEMRDLGTQLQDLLGGIHRTTETAKGEIKGVEDAVQKLAGITSQAAQSIAKMTVDFQQGQITAEFYLKTLDEVARKGSGTETGELARYLADEVRHPGAGGGRGGGGGGGYGPASSPSGRSSSSASRQGSSFNFNLPPILGPGAGPLILDHLGNPMNRGAPTAMVDPITGAMTSFGGGGGGNLRTGGSLGGPAGGGGSYARPAASDAMERMGQTGFGPAVVEGTSKAVGAAITPLERKIDLLLAKVARFADSGGGGAGPTAYLDRALGEADRQGYFA